MRRLHLLELEDQPWFPRTIRDAGTDYLQMAGRGGGMYAPVAPLVCRALAASGARRVVDLCSGGGGPWPTLREELAACGPAPEVVLTDRYPNRSLEERIRAGGWPGIRLHPDPVDATAVPPGLAGFRTLFTALHHFRPPTARAILADAAARGEGIGVFEFTERSLRGVLVMLLAPLLVLVLTPAVRPFRLSRLFWTYLVPVVPLFVLWDGIVSSLRTYTPDELRGLVQGLGGERYRWEAGQVRGRGPLPVTYLIGLPTPEGGGAPGPPA